MALAAKGQKKKKGSKIDISKVRCYSCNTYGHYASQCPNKQKVKQQVAATAEIEEFSSKFEQDFSLVSMVSSTDSNNYIYDNTWLIDSGSTSHMTGKLDTFHIIHEIGRGHYVNGTHEVRGIGKVIFQLEFNETLELYGVLFFPGLRDNLISVSALEDDGL